MSIFAAFGRFKTCRLIWYFPGVKILNTQMCFWDGKFLQGRKDVPTNDPIKKKTGKKNMGYQCGSTLKFETTIHQMFKNYQKCRIPKRQVTSFQKTSGLVFFSQWNIYPSTHTGGVFVFFVYRTGLPRTHVVLFHRSHITWFFPHKVVVRSQTTLLEKLNRNLSFERWEVDHGKSKCFFSLREKIWMFDRCNKNSLKNGLDLDRTTI